MDYTLQQRQKFAQKMTLSPFMLRRLALLQYPILQLREEIIKEVQDNPALDMESDPQSASLESLELESYNGPTIMPNNGRSSTVDIEYLLASPKTLSEHLKWQLHMEQLNDVEIDVGERIIDNLDKRGFLRDDPLFLCLNIEGANDIVIARVQGIIQQLDPLGCAVWNVSESILLQVDQLQLDDEIKKKIIEYCSLLYSEHISFAKEQALVQKFQNDENLQQVFHLVNPYPGSVYAYESHKIPDVIVPDAVIQADGDGLRVEINNDIVPVLCVSKEMKLLMSKNDSDAKEMVESMVGRADQFIEGLQYREYIFEQVIIYVANVQKDYFFAKRQNVVPLTQKDLAEALQLNISTVSRIVTNKFVETPQGLVPLQIFFSQRNERQKEYSSKIMDTISNIVTQYKGKKHLSDRIISEELTKQGIHIARRTVAKYRKLLRND